MVVPCCTTLKQLPCLISALLLFCWMSSFEIKAHPPRNSPLRNNGKSRTLFIQDEDEDSESDHEDEDDEDINLEAQEHILNKRPLLYS